MESSALEDCRVEPWLQIMSTKSLALALAFPRAAMRSRELCAAALSGCVGWPFRPGFGCSRHSPPSCNVGFEQGTFRFRGGAAAIRAEPGPTRLLQLEVFPSQVYPVASQEDKTEVRILKPCFPNITTTVHRHCLSSDGRKQSRSYQP